MAPESYLQCHVSTAMITRPSSFFSFSISDHGSVNQLVNLVYKLIQLTQSPGQQVAQEAGRCLAEIGPTDLRSVAIKGQCRKVALSSALSQYDNDHQMQRYCEIFYLLDDCLNDARSALNMFSTLICQFYITRGLHIYYTDVHCTV